MGGEEKLVVVAGHTLNVTESKYTELEKLVFAVGWAVRKFPSFFMRCQNVEVILPLPEMVMCIKDKGVNLKLRARLLDLEAITITWKKGKN